MFNYSIWKKTPFSTRLKIASIFKIEKRGPTKVFNDVVEDDGFKMEEVETALTLHAVQKYLGTEETDLHVLWGYLVDKVEEKVVFKPKESDVSQPISVLPKEEAAQFNKEYEERNPGKTAPVAGAEEAPVVKQRGRPKKTI